MNITHSLVILRGGPLDGMEFAISPLEFGTELRIAEVDQQAEVTIVTEHFYQLAESHGDIGYRRFTADHVVSNHHRYGVVPAPPEGER